jgi:hypothetical protein
LSGDSSSALPNEHIDQRDDAANDVDLQILTCEIQSAEIPFFALHSGSTTGSSSSQQNFDDPASTGVNDCQVPQNTRHPTSKLWAPDDATSQLNKSFTVPFQTSVPPTDRSTTMKPAKPPHPFRNYSSSLPEIQQHSIMPDHAHKALQDVIGYRKRKPPGFPDLEDGMVLSKLAERLRHIIVLTRNPGPASSTRHVPRSHGTII